MRRQLHFKRLIAILMRHGWRLFWKNNRIRDPIRRMCEETTIPSFFDSIGSSFSSSSESAVGVSPRAWACWSFLIVGTSTLIISTLDPLLPPSLAMATIYIPSFRTVNLPRIANNSAPTDEWTASALSITHFLDGCYARPIALLRLFRGGRPLLLICYYSQTLSWFVRSGAGNRIQGYFRSIVNIFRRINGR